ncbi:DEAD/DEAH box helicase [Photobacterium kasasachensis]|uniref:DEAD/DEAH box helicase n=1 Tax=Photobacterium kasasachensis TaxID=2910240 RepID=UPI003D1406DD
MATLIENAIGKSELSWLNLSDSPMSRDDVYESWCKANFIFKEEDVSNRISGLRKPQIGGIFAALGFERSDESGAVTIVMPTGTGKTETILSIVVAGKFKRTLVVVPSDALREQTKGKFVKLGLLRELGLIGEGVANPIVTTIKQGVQSDDILEKLTDANVIVTTASALTQFSKRHLNKLTEKCSHLIVDEAHHVTAKSWARIKSKFTGKPVFQFTATPFRTDLSRIEGRIIFNYPLSKAQEDGYFKPIEFHPVREFVEEVADVVIARKAIELLKKDISSGLDHILMARANTIKRAEQVFEIYKNETDLNPVLLTSKVNQKKEILASIQSGKHKIIVCANMLGEGFDLPQLKVSAVHDPHKSINVMLQFTGRFTRTTENVGNAKFIANIADPKVNDNLDELYREDSDWNSIVSDISAKKVDDEKSYQSFKEEFSSPSKLLDLGLTPNISTTVYRMNLAKWQPENFYTFGNKNFQVYDSIINDEQDTLVFSVKSYLSVGWTSSKELYDESWDLYIAYYDNKSGLLFVHSSAKDGLVKRLVGIIAKGAVQVQGEQVFRVLAGLSRLKLQNVGLNKNKKGLRYSMHTGTEINDQIPDIEAKRAIKSNIFGKGFENGGLVSIGCSYKGKVWSMDSDSLDNWVSWCKDIGAKILDDSINTNAVMKTAMQTEELEEFPDIPVLSVEWPVTLLRKDNAKIFISSPNWKEPLTHCELSFAPVQNDSHLMVFVGLKTEHGDEVITATLNQKGEVLFTHDNLLELHIGEHSVELAEYLNENPPTFFLADTSVIDGGLRYYLSDDYAYLYNLAHVESWNWAGIDISVESQTEARLTNSIQYKTIQNIIDEYDVVFDDDGSGEVADIVAIRNQEDRELTIDLYHCKYCSKSNGVAKPRARVEDVYQVAGQAVKSVKWFGDKEKLIDRLIERERARLRKNKASRIDKGKIEDLLHLSKVARYASFKLGISIVQPAIGKSQISNEQLSVLGATEAYIQEVSGVNLRVIVSP